jgi:hypothetical protein
MTARAACRNGRPIAARFEPRLSNASMTSLTRSETRKPRSTGRLDRGASRIPWAQHKCWQMTAFGDVLARVLCRRVHTRRGRILLLNSEHERRQAETNGPDQDK